jgi:uridine kinase
MKPFIVGIAGGTASGKTTIARQLVHVGGSERVVVIELDRYYRSQEHLPPEQRATLNYDHPAALEFNLLIAHVQQLRRGNVIDAPLYDFTTHCRDPLRTTRIDPKPIIIVEGVLVFANAELCTLLNLKIFIDTPEEVRRQRRVERDARERGRSVESTNAQWNESVQPMHQEFCEPSKAVADIVIDGRDNLQKTGESLWSIVWNRAQSHESIGCGVEQ